MHMHMHWGHFLEHASGDKCGKCRSQGKQTSEVGALGSHWAGRAYGRKAALLGIDFFLAVGLGRFSPKLLCTVQRSTRCCQLGLNHATRQPSAKIPIRRRVTQGSEDRESMKKKSSVDRGVAGRWVGSPAGCTRTCVSYRRNRGLS